MRYGYIRVSTRRQDETRQISALLENGISRENIFIDKSSGKSFIGREEWNRMMVTIEIGDIIVVKELDRLGRNNQEIKDTFEKIKRKGAYLEFLEQPLLNTSNKSQIEIELLQPVILHLLGYFAEKERESLKQRQKEGYANLPVDEKGRKISRKKNKVIGRPNKIENLTKEQKRYIKAWLDKNIIAKECMVSTGLSKSSLYRIKKIYNTK